MFRPTVQVVAYRATVDKNLCRMDLLGRVGHVRLFVYRIADDQQTENTGEHEDYHTDRTVRGGTDGCEQSDETEEPHNPEEELEEVHTSSRLWMSSMREVIPSTT